MFSNSGSLLAVFLYSGRTASGWLLERNVGIVDGSFVPLPDRNKVMSLTTFSRLLGSGREPLVVVYDSSFKMFKLLLRPYIELPL
ncbi:hypothetical protein V8F33_007449 [Rhypophila sp. PSN 637]